MNRVTRVLMGLSVVAGTLVATRPANAVLKDLVNEFTTTSTGTGWCMGVAGGNPAPGTSLILWQCNGNADQNWTPATFWGSYVQLRNGINSNLCAGLAGGSTNNGTQLQNNTCHSPNSSDDQGWLPQFFMWDATGHACNYYKNQKAAAAGLTRVFGVSGGAGFVKNGTNIILWDYLAHSDQIWCTY
jgi:hypothetical protein